MKRTLVLVATIATAFSGLAIATATTASAAPRGCHEAAPGVYVSQVDGVNHYSQDSRCGDINDLRNRPTKPSKPSKPAEEQCHDVYINGQLEGQLCGEGLDKRPEPPAGRGGGGGGYYFGGGGFFFSGGSIPNPKVTVGELEQA
ncbi:hypothetical protein [Nocardioides sp. AE5]|uniref:hypothetical protein n=1 Tax=Nocardioides sp. AE5 TaxID=2962573 RepID=UPI002882C90E|nr:hypothetical protein [Nocardioides sp. AE5]MDT0202943.1 hypothetical protein [Nocardioides sp. AE5]